MESRSDATAWWRASSTLKVPEGAMGTINLNLDGLRATYVSQNPDGHPMLYAVSTRWLCRRLRGR
jgi:hypothetical protein